MVAAGPPMRHVVRRQPLLHVRRRQEGLIATKWNELVMRRSCSHSNQDGNPIDCWPQPIVTGTL
jgi:hypothetical protein